MLSSVPTRATASDQSSGVPDWAGVITTHGNELARLQTDQSAVELFTGTIGPALALHDAAAAVGAKGIPPKLAKDLLIQEITNSARRLVGGLTAWLVAERITRVVAKNPDQGAADLAGSSPQTEWLSANGQFPSLDLLIQLSSRNAGPSADSTARDGTPTAVAIAAGRLAQEAQQRVVTEWWRLKTWKDRVRAARGRARLCGTWQWVIHDHKKHHQEQKLSLVFPPPGGDEFGVQGLVEVTVLGDNVYLRWEANGLTQEDSLLFSKEDQRLEGTFVNSQGSWGAITGKRTGICTMK